jgi:phytoene dehydrogenase-like protein
MSPVSDFDVVVVGAGPNGLVAAVTLARAGRRVLVIEAASTPGGGTRSQALTRPGHVHDVCSAVHPLALASPVLRDLPLADHGLEWVHPGAPLAHPLDGGRAVLLERSVDATALALGDDDGAAYLRLMTPLVGRGRSIVDAVLSPLTRPPLASAAPLARFGRSAVQPAQWFAARRVASEEAQALFAGLAAHSVQPLAAPATAGVGLLLGVLGHLVGWPLARGGSQAIADALVALLLAEGGEVVVGHPVRSLHDVPPAPAIVCDLTPRQLLDLGGVPLPARYRRRLNRFRYGPGVWKVDWALDGPIPWAAEGCHRAGTVHVGGSLAEIAEAEHAVPRGRVPERPMVLLAQPTLFDPTRAPAGEHNAWAYCHVPNGSPFDMTDRIEAQVERFAPGFRDRIVARHVMGPAAVEAHDPNYVGGDIASGRLDLTQLVARPVAARSPWTTPVPGLFLCGASTPPGPGVHGMGGWHAAQAVLARS